ncbi:putative reverse transcriptase domain-containing protein [Tanacetum coccineum]
MIEVHEGEKRKRDGTARGGRGEQTDAIQQPDKTKEGIMLEHDHVVSNDIEMCPNMQEQRSIMGIAGKCGKCGKLGNQKTAVVGMEIIVENAYNVRCVVGSARLNKEEYRELAMAAEKLFAKFSSVIFWLDSVQFLGHVIDSNGVHVDPAKIEAIKNWAAPTTPTKVRKFLGLACYYRSAPILSLPEGSEDFVVYCDASLKGFGAVLMQREKVIALQYILDQKELNMNGSECLTCAKVKVEHQKPSGYHSAAGGNPCLEMVRELPMDSLRKLHETPSGYDQFGCHCTGCCVDYFKTETLVCCQDFWRSLQKSLGTNLDMSTAYHPETDGQSERTIQTLEDMLRACVIDFGSGWDKHLPLVEFSYNNSYHASIKSCNLSKLLDGKEM